MLRTLAERLSRGIVLRRRMPRDLGGQRIFVAPDASLRYWRLDMNQVDPKLLDVVREYVQPGHVVWDIGANVGLVSFAAAGRAGPQGKVLAIEADTWLVELLRRSARQCGPAQAPVEVVPVAVTDRVGFVHFAVAARGRASNSVAGFGRSMAGGQRALQTVPTTSLDELLQHFDPPNFVKIDVEGAEDLVLKGGAKLLDEHRPVLLCEVGREEEKRAFVTRLLLDRGYQLYNMNTPRAERVPLSSAAWNTIAVPSRS